MREGKEREQLAVGAGLECQKCGHKWNTRSGWKPVQCPRCKSTTWDRPLAALREAAVAYRTRPTMTQETVQTGSGAWMAEGEIWEAQKMMDWSELGLDAGWGDEALSVDEMLAEVRSGWRLVDPFGEDETEEVSG